MDISNIVFDRETFFQMMGGFCNGEAINPPEVLEAARKIERQDVKVITFDKDSNLVSHAKRELKLSANDDDFNETIINAVAAFASYGHSGGSASIAIPIVNDLLQYKNLTPLTDNPDEWMKVEMGDEECWQNRRNPEAFSNDHGVTYYILSERAPIRVSMPHAKEN